MMTRQTKIYEPVPPQELSLEGDVAANWNSFKSQFETYLSESGNGALSDNMKLRLFLETVGREGVHIYNSLNMLKADKQTLRLVFKEFGQKIIPANIVYERFVFYSRKQKSGERFDIFFRDLKCLIASCRFGDVEDSLRDQIVLGVRDRRVQKKLLKSEGLTLETAVGICQNAELRKRTKRIPDLERASDARNGVTGTTEMMTMEKNFFTDDRSTDSGTLKNEPTDDDGGISSQDTKYLERETNVGDTAASNVTNLCESRTDTTAVTPSESYYKFIKNTPSVNGPNEADLFDNTCIPYNCSVRSPSYINDRVIYQPMPSRPFSCEECNKCFKTKEHLKKHTFIHTGERPYKCGNCSKSFALKSNMNKHMFLHENKHHKCNFCKKSFITKEYLKKHLVIHKDECDIKPDKHYEVKCEMLKGDRPYQCDICSKRFSKKGNFNEHILTHTGIRPYQCDICSKSFLKKGNFNQHSLTHKNERPYQCDICSKSFLTKQHLKMHMMTHTGERPQQCELCANSFSTKKALKIHMLVHTGERPHLCHICNKGYSQKGSLKMHMLTHTGERPHQCNICSKCFSTKEYLKKHMLTHTGEQPYSCESCGKRFAVKSNLNKHALIHTNERPHRCNICNKCFTRKQDLKKHSGVHERPHQCDICNKNFARKERLKKHMSVHRLK